MSVADRGRKDPQPLGQGWELPFVLLTAALIGAGLAALAGCGAAAAVLGGGWVWPHGTQPMLHTLGGLLSGHPGAGLTPQAAAKIPAPAAVYAGVGLAEILFLTTTLTVAALACRRWRPGAGSGMATRAQAVDALGVAELRAARGLIRPDLYPARDRKGGERS